MIPQTITRTHLLHAIQQLESGEQVIPIPRLQKKFDLLFEGKRYPPKYVTSLAYKDVAGYKLHHFTGGAETNNFLASRGFQVVWKNTRKSVGIVPVDEDEESTFPEGRKVYRLHRKYERDSKITKLAKAKRLAETGDLRCEICSFSFAARYGSPGLGYIEAHHTIPVSQLRGKQKTKLSDIALVCSNCHRMLHHRRPWLSAKDLIACLSKSTKRT
jgi:hypothetical protein